MFTRAFTIQANLFGVTLFSKEEMEHFHETEIPTITNLKTIKLVVLQIRAERKSWWTDEDILKYETEIPYYFQK